VADEPERLTGADIICVGYGAWDGLKGTLHHVMARLAEHNRVLYVEGAPPSRPPCRWRWVCSAVKGATAWLRRVRAVEGNVSILRPPGCAPGAARPLWLSRRLLVDPVRQNQRRLGFRRPILWCAYPSGVHLVGRLDERLVVYHCLDDYGCVPCVEGRTVRDLEDRLLAGADLVLAASGHLFRGLMHEHPNAYYVPVAVDVEHFAPTEPAREMPADLAALPRPLLGYIGALTPQTVDLELLREVAQAYPNWSICLIGPAGRPERAAFDLMLGGLDNVHFLGRKTYADLPAYYKHLDAVLLPYLLTEHTRALFPPQFVEAMAAGKPLVITDLDAIEHYRLSHTLCRVALDRDEFVSLVEAALAEPLKSRDVALRRDHARRYSLDRRMADIETLLLHSLASRG